MYACDGYGRDERNFAEYPMSLLMGNSSDETSPTTLSYEDSIPHPVTGMPIKRRFVMKSTGDHGMPATLDEEILLGLFSIHYQKNGFADDFFHVTPHEMVSIMEWKKTGYYYHRFCQSLHRWRDIKLDFYGAWYDVVNQGYTDAFMAVIPNFIIHPNSQSGTTKSYEITWDRILHQNLKAGYIRVIDLKIYRRLRSPIAKRMYRYLGANPNNAGKTLVYDLTTFSYKQLGMSPGSYKSVAQLKRTLDSSFQALEQEGFIIPTSSEFRYQKYARGRYRLHIELTEQSSTQLTPRVPANPSPALPAPSLKPAVDEHPLVHELVNRGVFLIKARDLVKKHPSDYISEWIARTDLMDDHEFKKDRASTLVWAIRDNPPTFGRVAKKQHASPPYHAPVLETFEEPDDPIMVYLEGLTAEGLSNLRKEANLKHPDDLDRLKKDLNWLRSSEDKFQKALDYGAVNLLYGENLKNRLT